MRRRILSLVGCLMGILLVLPVFGQDTSTAPTQPAATTAPEPQQGGAPAPAPAPAPPTWSAGPIDFSGAVVGYYSYNLQHPADRTNRLYNFNIPAQQFNLDLIEVGLSHSPDPIGGEIDLGYGQAFKTFNAFDNDGGFNQYVRQAFVSVKPAKLKGFEVDFGKFVTSAGAEVIEAYTNWNYSHSLLFAWAIPYYHFGVRTSMPVGKHVTAGFQVVNGWNNLTDNNSGKTIGVNGTVTYDKFVWSAVYYGGPENANTNKGWRNLIDTNLILMPSSKINFDVNYDYGQNRNTNAAGTLTTSLATWKGFAGAVKLQPTPKWAFIGRGEWFDDTNGFNTGTAQTVDEATFTTEYKLIEGFVWRGEYRYDWSDQPFFLDHACVGSVAVCPTLFSGNSKHQGTLSFAIMAFFGPKR